MSDLIMTRLTSKDDPDLPLMRETLMSERFISIDGDAYFDYVTGTENVYFYAVRKDGRLAAVLQAEPSGGVLSLMLTVMPGMRRRGIGRAVITEICRRLPEFGCSVAEAAIDPANGPSLRLFESCGFLKRSEEDGLEIWVYDHE